MILHIVKIIEDVKRYFEHAGMYDYRITNIEVKTEHWLRITIVEISPSGTEGDPFVLDFSNGNGYLNIQHAITEEDVFDYAEEFGWDEKTVHYIRCGTPLRKE